MLPWLLCGALALLSLLLLVRLAALHRSLDELRAFFAQNIAEESNGLIRLSSRDPYVLSRRRATDSSASPRAIPMSEDAPPGSTPRCVSCGNSATHT